MFPHHPLRLPAPQAIPFLPAHREERVLIHICGIPVITPLPLFPMFHREIIRLLLLTQPAVLIRQLFRLLQAAPRPQPLLRQIRFALGKPLHSLTAPLSAAEAL